MQNFFCKQLLDCLASAARTACNSPLDTCVVGLGAWVSAVFGGPIEGSLAISSTFLSSSSSTGSRKASCWFLVCEAMRGHSTRMVVVSLGGPGQVPSCQMQCSSWRSGVGACDMIWGFGVHRGFEVLFYYQVMVMDYCRLNKQTAKNNYPLLLITDLVDSIGNKRVFTKMDLQWEYNNVRIKEGDE